MKTKIVSSLILVLLFFLGIVSTALACTPPPITSPPVTPLPPDTPQQPPITPKPYNSTVPSRTNHGQTDYPRPMNLKHPILYLYR